MDQQTIDYYTRREQQARALAANATEPGTQAAHLKMANAYAGLLAGQAAETPASSE